MYNHPLRWRNVGFESHEKGFWKLILTKRRVQDVSRDQDWTVTWSNPNLSWYQAERSCIVRSFTVVRSGSHHTGKDRHIILRMHSFIFKAKRECASLNTNHICSPWIRAAAHAPSSTFRARVLLANFSGEDTHAALSQHSPEQHLAPMRHKRSSPNTHLDRTYRTRKT